MSDKPKRITYHPLRTARRDRAIARQTERDKRTVNEQLSLIDSRPGKSRRERKKIATPEELLLHMIFSEEMLEEKA